MTKDIKLTQLSPTGGCAAKIGPGTLARVLKDLKFKTDSRLIVGTDTSDDAGAWQLDENTVILQTLDFFPPMVDDPYTFGQIAATNALSDVYAMGGKPLTALNIVCFPQNESGEILEAILRGGRDKIQEAGAVVAGGHSIDDPVPKYGLSVMGKVRPENLRVNACALPGDRLILTKPIGTGILTLAMRGGICPPAGEKAAIASMTTLNAAACSILNQYDVHAVTDVTGFSLGGHSIELAAGSGVTAVIEAQRVPLLPDIIPLAEEGIVPGGSYRNRDYFSDRYHFDVKENRGLWEDLMFDPQTSGGLLISVSEADADKMLAQMREELTTDCAEIGHIEPAGDVPLIFI